MKYNQMTVMKDKLLLIDIDHGHTASLNQGDHELDKVFHEGREFHVLYGTRVGSLTSYLEDFEKAGTIKLSRMAEDSDPTWHGIALPITSSSQVSNTLHQQVIAHLVKGKLLCEKCTLHKSLTFPDAIAIYPRHLLPMSQDCHGCGQMLVDIARNKRGPDMVFKKSEPK